MSLSDGNCGGDSELSLAFILFNEFGMGGIEAIPGIEKLSIHDRSTHTRAISRESSILHRYLSLLNSWNQTELEDAKSEPQYLLLPFMQLIALHRMRRIKVDLTSLFNLGQRTFQTIKRFDDLTHLHSYGLNLHEQTTIATVRSLKHWIRRFGTANSPKLTDQLNMTVADFDSLLADIKYGQNYLEKYKNDFAMRRSLEDSHAATQQSDRANRLANLAFVFIPLSLVTSVFGMNVQELGAGDVKMWTALVTAITALFIAFVLRAVFSLISPYLKELEDRVSGFNQTFVHWKRFAAVAPLQGAWLILFMLMHSPYHYELYLTYLGLDSNAPWEMPRFYVEETLLHNNLTSFWISKGNDICQITRVNGWDRRTIVSRLWAKYNA